jgi:hypothetical protein
MFWVLGMSQLTKVCIGFRCVCGCIMHGCKDREWRMMSRRPRRPSRREQAAQAAGSRQ